MLARHRRQQRYPRRLPPVPCSIQACPDRAEDRATLCPRHRKHRARTGSPVHPGLTIEQRQPVVRAIGRTIRQAIKRNDLNTEMMVHELTQLIHALPSGLPRLNGLRYRSPLVKAQAILFHVNRQHWAHTQARKKTPRTEQTWMIQLLAWCMASELLAPAVCSAPMYVRTQVSQGLYSRLWRYEPKNYEVENGRGGMVRTVVYNKRPGSLQSKWTARRLYELVEPCYREWFRAHIDELKTAVPANMYTMAE